MGVDGLFRFDLWYVEGERLTAKQRNASNALFFPLELNLFLECCELARVNVGSFPEFDRESSVPCRKYGTLLFCTAY